MSIRKLILTLFFALLATSIEARNSTQSVGRVVRVDGSKVELVLVEPAVGALYDLRRRRASSPKATQPLQEIQVGQVRVTEVLGEGRASAVVVRGSAWRGDRAFRTGIAE